MVATVRLAGDCRQGGKHSFEAELSCRHLVQRNCRPGHTTTRGKAGAHAAVASYRLLTRDALCYRTYFTGLDVRSLK